MAMQQMRADSPAIVLIGFVSAAIDEAALTSLRQQFSCPDTACTRVVLITDDLQQIDSQLQDSTDITIICAGPGLDTSLAAELENCNNALIALLHWHGDCLLTPGVMPRLMMATRVPGLLVGVPGYQLGQNAELDPTRAYDLLEYVDPGNNSCLFDTKVGFPVLFLAAHDFLALAEEGFAAGAFDFLSLQYLLRLRLSGLVLAGEALINKAGSTRSLDLSDMDPALQQGEIHAPMIFGTIGLQAQNVFNSQLKRANPHLLAARPAPVPILASDKQPRLSMIVIAYRMPGQLQRSLQSLAVGYQLDVRESDYEVIIVENDSDSALSAAAVASLPANFHYFCRQESSSSPAAAINFGLAQARGKQIGLMIDGAHMLSPGVLRLAMLAATFSDRAFVTVPTYHLGPAEQHISSQQGYSAAEESRLLASISWPDNPYALFSIASWCGANPRGYFAPIMESNCYFAPHELFASVGGADESYQQPGGGSLNLDIVRKLGTASGVDYFCLPGEGSFHQYHGGVTSNSSRADHVQRFKDELHERWDQKYRFLERNPLLLGGISAAAFKNLEFSSDRMLKRFENFKDRLHAVWADDYD